MARAPLTHIYPHRAAAAPDLYSLLPAPVHVTTTPVSPRVSGITAIEAIKDDDDDELTHNRADSSSPPFHGFSDSELQPNSSYSLKTSPVSRQCTVSDCITQTEKKKSKEKAIRSRSITPPLTGYNSDLEPQTALVSTPIKGTSPSIPMFSPSNQTSRSPAHEHSVAPNRLQYQQIDPATMFECTKCENLFVDFQDVLDHVDTFHPGLDTMAAIRRPEARFLVTMECPVCRDRAVASRDERLMLDHILVKHGERMVDRENIIWSCRMCDTQAENEDTILKHVRERHGSVDRKNNLSKESSPRREFDGSEEKQPFIKRFKLEVEKRVRDYAEARSVSEEINDSSSENGEDESDNEDKEQETGRNPENVLTRGQRLAVMKSQLELLLKETKDLKRFLVMEENNNDTT